jgi:hypothetical protein
MDSALLWLYFGFLPSLTVMTVLVGDAERIENAQTQSGKVKQMESRKIGVTLTTRGDNSRMELRRKPEANLRRPSPGIQSCSDSVAFPI